MEIIKDKDRSLAPVDERVAALEKKMREIEAMVKGLTEELLDLKSVTMKLSKASEERTRAEMRLGKPAAPTPGGPVILQKKPVATPPLQRPAQAPVETAPEKMDMIMQPNGTLAPEKRKNSDYIIASAGFSKKKQSAAGPGKKNDLIVAEDEETDSAHKK
ncbi:MAG: hypothetical protein A4E37_01484 [Methanoregulaceae archaeon PtaB.Bin056]|nr:MAG: hypothetical protein A4E37_01484 [Methanoregulaceae archaeon PtaB.Bin056]